MTLMIGDNLVVGMHYTLTNNEGEVLDSSEGRDPLVYLHGAGNIIPGLEKAMVGKTEGDSLEVKVAPEEAYGVSREELIQVVPRSAFQGVEEIQPGMVFNAQGPNGEVQRVEVAKVEADEITVDANHPLAGVELNFAVQVVSIREASEDEISQGQVN